MALVSLLVNNCFLIQLGPVRPACIFLGLCCCCSVFLPPQVLPCTGLPGNLLQKAFPDGLFHSGAKNPNSSFDSPWSFAYIFTTSSPGLSPPLLHCQLEEKFRGSGRGLAALPGMSCFSARDCSGDGENFRKSCVHSTRHIPGLEPGEKADHLPQGFLKCGCNSASSISPTWELVRNANSSSQHRPVTYERLGVGPSWVARSLPGGSDAGCTEVPNENSLTQTNHSLG